MLFTPIHKIEERGQREQVDQTITSLFGVSRITENRITKKNEMMTEITTELV